MSDITSARGFVGYQIKDGAEVRYEGVWYVYDESADVLRVKNRLGLQRSPQLVSKLKHEAKQILEQSKKPKRSKYNNKATVVDGIRFDSKAEASYYEYLQSRKVDGVVEYFLIQVPVRLTAGVKYVVDFQVFYTNGTVRYIDVKGVETAIFKLKKRQVEELYPITIEAIKWPLCK